MINIEQCAEFISMLLLIGFLAKDCLKWGTLMDAYEILLKVIMALGGLGLFLIGMKNMGAGSRK